MARLGILGGSFDPVHLGHLACARAARMAEDMDRVLLMVAPRAPHKPGGATAPEADRLDLVRLAVEDEPGLEASDFEFGRSGPTWTVQTLRDLSAETDDELWLILGTDSVAELADWREPAEILALARPLVCVRPGAAPCFDDLEEALGRPVVDALEAATLDVGDWEVSSTEVRRRLAAGESLDGLVPGSVAHEIERRGLYKP